MVPVVPIAATKWVSRPPVCDQSSGPVVSRCALRVRRVGVLVRVVVPVGMRLRQLAGPPRRPLRALEPVGDHHLGAVHFEQRAALGARVAGKADRHPDAGGRSEHGVGDAGVAARRVQQPAPGHETAIQRVAEDGPRRAVLHAAARVHPLRLEPESSAAAGQLHREQRGLAHRLPQRRLRLVDRCRTAVIAHLQNKKPDRLGRVPNRERVRQLADEIPTSSWTWGSCFIRSAREMLASSSSTRC